MRSIVKECLIFILGIFIGSVITTRTTIKYITAASEEIKNYLQRNETDREET